MSIAAKRITVTFLILCMVLASGIFGFAPVHGAGEITMEYVSDVVTAVDGGSAMMQVNLTNNSADAKTVTVTASVAEKDSSYLSISTDTKSTTVEPGETGKKGLQFTIYAQGVSPGFYTVTFNASWDGGGTASTTGTLRIQLDTSGGVIDTTPSTRTYHPVVNIEHSLGIDDVVYADTVNSLSVNLKNSGDCNLIMTEVTVSMPDGLSLNNEGTTKNLGRLDRERRTSTTFSIIADGDVKTKNYPVSITVKASDPSGGRHTFENTIYIPVVNENEGGSMKDILISGIVLPATASYDQDLTLSFDVTNQGDREIKNVQVAVEAPAGLLNKTPNMFIESSFKAGEKKTYTVTYFTENQGEGSSSSKTFPIKLAVSSLDGEDSFVASQYTSVFVSKSGDTSLGETSNPRIMVDQYTFGDDDSVQAGSEFVLGLTLRNTSDRTLGNIKVSLSSGDGAFVPVNSSNAFFVESIPARSTVYREVALSVSPTAEQRTTAITVNMEYEGGEGDSYTADDTISIPVTQDTRLVTDDVVPPYECYVGSMSYAEISFYNMGKTTLRNLKIDAQGDFDIMESNSYYVGNMESGRSDSYSFTFMPRQVGPVTGSIVFTYEDVNGKQQIQEAAFTFEAMEMPVWDDPFMEDIPMEETKTIPWKWIIILVVIVAAVVFLVVFLRRRKKKAHAALELADAMEDLDDMEIPEETPNDK